MLQQPTSCTWKQEDLPHSPSSLPCSHPQEKLLRACELRTPEGKYNNEFIMKPLRLLGSRGAAQPPAWVSAQGDLALLRLQSIAPLGVGGGLRDHRGGGVGAPTRGTPFICSQTFLSVVMKNYQEG